MAKGYSSYVDSMTDMKMSKAFRDFAPMDVISTVSTEFRYLPPVQYSQVPLLAPYVDFFSFGITALLSSKHIHRTDERLPTYFQLSSVSG